MAPVGQRASLFGSVVPGINPRNLLGWATRAGSGWYRLVTQNAVGGARTFPSLLNMTGLLDALSSERRLRSAMGGGIRLVA